MPARPSPCARAMDAVALLMDLPAWDREERRALLEYVRPRLLAIVEEASWAGARGPEAAAWALGRAAGLARECARALEAWAEGDLRENARHREALAAVRALAGELEGR